MNANPLIDDYNRAKAKLRKATEDRARDYDRLMTLARGAIMEQLEQMHGATLRKAEADLEAAARAMKQGRASA